MRKRPLTLGFIIFYILFWPDTYRILFGVAVAIIFAPFLLSPDMGAAGSAMIHVMIATIAYAVFGKPAQAIARNLQKLVLKNKRH